MPYFVPASLDIRLLWSSMHIAQSFFFYGVLKWMHISKLIFHSLLFFPSNPSLMSLWYPKAECPQPIYVRFISKPFSAESVSVSMYLDLLTWTRHPPLGHTFYEQGVQGQHKPGSHTGYITAPERDPQTSRYCSVRNLMVIKKKPKKHKSKAIFSQNTLPIGQS